MNDAIYRISLDIHEHGSQTVLKAKKTDTGRQLCISLREGGRPYIIEDGCYAVFKATKPDGSILYNACTIENNEIIYEFTEQTCTAVGRCRCEIALYGQNDKLITSPRFALLVDGTIYPDGRVESSDEFSALTKLVTDALESTENAKNASDNANDAANSANASAVKANDATQNANQATTAAMQAAQNATNVAENVNEVINNANQSIYVATDAAGRANVAADSANEAATKAAQTAQSLEEQIAGTDVRFLFLDGNFSPEFESGTVSFTDGQLVYSDKSSHIRTKEGKAYRVPKGTVLALSDYTNARLVVYYSYDGGVTYTGFTVGSDYLDFFAEKEATIVLRMQSLDGTAVDTSLANLLTVDVQTVFDDILNVAVRDIGGRISAIDGNFAPEFELGDVSVSGNTFTYNKSTYRLRTKRGVTYRVPAGTSFMLSDYSIAYLAVFYSYDGGVTYSNIAVGKSNKVFAVEQDAVVFLRIQTIKQTTDYKQTDTSLANLLVVDVPSIKNVVEKELNDVTLWEMGGINGSGERYDSTATAMTKGFIPEEVELIYVENDYQLYVVAYDSVGNYVGFWNGESFPQSADKSMRYFNPKGLSGYKYRVLCRSTNSSKAISVEDCLNVHFLNGIHKKAFYPQPTLTFIDDDGVLNALENWEAISDEIGVKVTFAINTGVMGDGTHASWDDVERLQNKGFEFVSHTHMHRKITAIDQEIIEGDFQDTIKALREHGCESRYLVYPNNAIDAEIMPLVKKYFTAGVGLASSRGNRLPLYTYEISRYSINAKNDDGTEKYEDIVRDGETVSVRSFEPLDTLKGYIDNAIVNGSWVIIMTHLRDHETFYYDDTIKQRIIALCRYAVNKGMTIQTFGEAFQRYKNIMENGTINSSQHYIVDCNGVVHHKGQEE